jgi:HD superfamily phosphohydrolase YqeK
MSVSPTDVRRRLPSWAAVGEDRIAHIARVMTMLHVWAAARGVPEEEGERWQRAALLHDALREADEQVLRRYPPLPAWPLKTWHGPAAATAATADGERDQGILDAVRYHSFGFAPWDDAGRMLYLADYLEPGRTFERERLDAFAARVPAEPARVLREVASMRLAWRIRNGGRIARETWEFWNSIAADASSSRD